MSATRGYRISTDIPEDLLPQVRAQAILDGVTLAELWHHWVTMAALLAHSGYGHLLPQGHMPRSGPVATARWRQNRSSLGRSRAAIEAVGSSIPAVLRVAGAAYVEAKGDHLAMSWPGLRADREAA